MTKSLLTASLCAALFSSTNFTFSEENSKSLNTVIINDDKAHNAIEKEVEKEIESTVSVVPYNKSYDQVIKVPKNNIERILEELKSKEQFHLDLKSAKKMALIQSNTVKSAYAQLNAAEFSQKISESSYYPTVDISASHQNRIHTPVNPLNSQQPYDYQNSLSLNSNYLLFDGGQRSAQTKISNENHKQKSYLLDNSKKSILTEISTRYYRGVFLLKRIKQAEDDLEYEKDNLKIARDRENAGIGKIIEVKNFELRINRIESTLLDLQNQWQILLAELAASFDVPSSELKDLKKLVFKAQDIKLHSLEYYYDLAKINRTEPKLAQSLANLASYNSDLAKSSLLPKISLFAQFDQNLQDTFTYNRHKDQFAVGLSLNLNLFRGYKDKYSIAREEALYLAQKFDVEKTNLTLRAEIESAYLNVQKSLKNITLEKTAMEIASTKREISDRRYRAGISGILELNEAQNEYSRAVTSYLLAEVTIANNFELLNLSTGVLE